MNIKTVLILVLVALLGAVMFMNATLVPVRLIFWSAYMPVFILVLGVFAAGLIVGYLVARLDRRRKPGALPAPAETPASEGKSGPGR